MVFLNPIETLTGFYQMQNNQHHVDLIQMNIFLLPVTYRQLIALHKNHHITDVFVHQYIDENANKKQYFLFHNKLNVAK